jgi:hypothetical protein
MLQMANVLWPLDGAKNYGSMDVRGFEPGVVGPKTSAAWGGIHLERDCVVAVLTGCDSAHPCSFRDTAERT